MNAPKLPAGETAAPPLNSQLGHSNHSPVGAGTLTSRKSSNLPEQTSPNADDDFLSATADAASPAGSQMAGIYPGRAPRMSRNRWMFSPLVVTLSPRDFADLNCRADEDTETMLLVYSGDIYRRRSLESPTRRCMYTRA